MILAWVIHWNSGQLLTLLQPQQAQASCQIYIATPKNSKLPARVRRVIRWFLEMHADLQPIPSQFLQ